MDLDPIAALTALDGRYAAKTAPLREFLSEKAYIAYRVRVELHWLIFMSEQPEIAEVPPFSADARREIEQAIASFSTADALRVKEFEAKTNHDVKAVEYWLKERFVHNAEIMKVSEFIHFACTSEDVNNIAWALMVKDAVVQTLHPLLVRLDKELTALAHTHADTPLLARTHGQAATPTTVGKELATFASRLRRAIARIDKVELQAKWNGAVGNYNAHGAAFPALDWPALARAFVGGFGLSFNAYTTQIEPHDSLCELLDAVAAVNNVLLGLVRDMWSYISRGLFGLRVAAGEVGSSVMPHKVNPIDFENSEGNLTLGTSLLRAVSDKLPVSRLQRDLSDSTVLRSLGTALGHSMLAWDSALRGLGKVTPCIPALMAELDEHWEVLAEPIQTVMRRLGLPTPYEQLKALTRGHVVTREHLHAFLDAQVGIPADELARLKALTPATYTGVAARLAREI